MPSLRTLAKHLQFFLLYGVAGALLTLVVGVIWLGVSRVPDLKPWHTALLTEEFTRADTLRVPDLPAYFALEDRLFAQLHREVYDKVDSADRTRLGRFTEGSLSDGNAYPDNGNRSYQMPVKDPACGAVLVHGLTDSPYFLKSLATKLHDRGCWVVGLRLPGHGTAPAALTRVEWQDWAAAVRLAVRDVRGHVGDERKVYLVGFSTGAALSVEYALARLEGEQIPRVDGLVLLSPAIGVDPLAWLAKWQQRLSRLPGLGKLGWLDITPEYEPYKYTSFPVNAGRQIYEVTQVIDERMTRLSAAGPVKGFPRTIIFQSVADATVSPQAVIRILLGRLAPEGHEAVAFDINRLADIAPLLRPDIRDPHRNLLEGDPWPFSTTLVTNESDSTTAIVAIERPAGSNEVTAKPTGLAWPAGVFAISHVAIPVPPDDPIYGQTPPRRSKAIFLGRVEIFGENRMIAIPPAALQRLRYDPFYSYVVERMMHFLDADSTAGGRP